MALKVYDYRKDVRNVLVTSQVRSRFLRMEPGQDSGAHSHDLGHEIFLVLEGCAEFTIAGESGVVGPGQMCVALVDQLHSLRVVGDAPMTMYLSVTPHIQPTHTMYTPEGAKLPHRFTDSAAYDIGTDISSSFDTLMVKLTQATSALRDAADRALAAQNKTSEDLITAISTGNLRSASISRTEIWDALIEVYRQSGALADLWNDVAPRAGNT